MSLLGPIFGPLLEVPPKPQFDSLATMENLELLQRQQRIGETWYYGGLTWHPKIGVTYGVKSGPFLTKEEADHTTIRQATLMGYKVPRWWQFWRWSERPLPSPSKDSDNGRDD
jgi:hypothetical protein